MENKLFQEFSFVTNEQWKNQIIQELKGEVFDKTKWKTEEGFLLDPFYTAENKNHEDFHHSITELIISSKERFGHAWKIRQEIEVDNLDIANKTALDYLIKGCNSLAFIFNEQLLHSQSDFSRLMQDIQLDAVELHFIGLHAADYVSMLLNEAEIRNTQLSLLHGSISFNPLAFILRNGACIERSPEIAFVKLASFLEFSVERLPNMQFINIPGNLFHNSGSNLSQELAYSLAMASDYLHILPKHGVSIEKVAKLIRLSLTVGSNYFMEIAKIRAARVLWIKMLEAWNLKEIPDLFIHAETSRWNMTIFDSYVNMLRNTTEAMSAVMAGANSLTIVPFNNPYAPADDFSERISRNLHHILKEEAYLDKTIDPSAGSYFIEELTSKLAQNAWTYFLDIEENGGFYSAINSGYIQNAIIEVSRQRDIAIAMGRFSILGTNKFPALKENPPSLVKNPVCCPPVINSENQIIHPLSPYRGAAAFESLRLDTLSLKEIPKVFLFTYGNPVMRKARAGFALTFFAVAGFEIIDNIGFNSLKEGIDAFNKSGAQILVACSSDDEYAEFVYGLHQQVSERAIFVVAGNPKNRNEMKKAGIVNFIHLKTNLLEKLQLYQDMAKKLIV
jgi:methylmalonyl-CoA mutase